MNNLSKLQTIVISLTRSSQRREKVQAEMTKTNLIWSFLDAVDGSKLNKSIPEYKSKKVIRLLGFELMPNEIGCFLSHKKAWQRCLIANQPTLIFEDDFILPQNFEEILQHLFSDFSEWKIMRLQGLAETPYTVLKTIGTSSIVKNLADPVGATAYIVKPEAAKILIQHAMDIYEPVDHFLEHKSKHGLEVLAVNPYPVEITRVPSTISDFRDERRPIKGIKKKIRSLNRTLDRIFSKDPWFPK